MGLLAPLSSLPYLFVSVPNSGRHPPSGKQVNHLPFPSCGTLRFPQSYLWRGLLSLSASIPRDSAKPCNEQTQFLWCQLTFMSTINTQKHGLPETQCPYWPGKEVGHLHSHDCPQLQSPDPIHSPVADHLQEIALQLCLHSLRTQPSLVDEPAFHPPLWKVINIWMHLNT